MRFNLVETKRWQSAAAAVLTLAAISCSVDGVTAVPPDPPDAMDARVEDMHETHDAGPSSSVDASANSDDDAGGPLDAGATTAQIPDFNGCETPDYEDRSADTADRSIAIAATGLNFAPKCMIIARGQRVRWQGSLSAHPLAPGNPDDAAAGSADSPIEATSSGSSVEFTFPTAGTYPYFCELHAFGTGQGMAGVVHVK